MTTQFKPKIVKLQNNKGDNGLCILVHMDIDGVCSALMLFKALYTNYDFIDVIFTQPFHSVQLARFIRDNKLLKKYNHFALLDISVNAHNPSLTVKLLTTLGLQLKYIFDHHTGWEKVINKNNFNFSVKINGEMHKITSGDQLIVISEDSSCAKVIYDYFNFDDTYMSDIVRISVLSDDLTFRVGEDETTNVYKAFIKLKNNSTTNALKCLSAAMDISEIPEPIFNAVEYRNTKADKIMTQVREVAPGIGYLSCFDDINFNFTPLYELAYKKYNFKILIIKQLSVKQMRFVYTIAHNIDNLDLTELFNMKAGNPKRITLSKKRFVPIKEIVSKLEKYAISD